MGAAFTFLRSRCRQRTSTGSCTPRASHRSGFARRTPCLLQYGFAKLPVSGFVADHRLGSRSATRVPRRRDRAQQRHDRYSARGAIAAGQTLARTVVPRRQLRRSLRRAYIWPRHADLLSRQPLEGRSYRRLGRSSLQEPQDLSSVFVVLADVPAIAIDADRIPRTREDRPDLGEPEVITPVASGSAHGSVTVMRPPSS